jgi:mannose-6-phosphate isomerase-like protein (cupin superfamily)
MMPTLPTTLSAFEAESRLRGYDQVLERIWQPDLVLETHTHDFAVWAIVQQGEVGLTVDGHTRLLRAGDSFTLEPKVPHGERYGPQGAVFWVARRHVEPAARH